MVTERIRYRVLGPLEAGASDAPLALGGVKQRAALALLLLEPNTVISRDRLIEGIWGESPPERAVNTIQVFFSDLRKALRPLGGGPIVTRAPGYAIELEPDELDLLVFERLAREGRDALARGDDAVAATKLEQAGKLWRGPPLAEFAQLPFASLEVHTLEEARLSAIEDRLEAQLRSGRGGELVAELTALVDTHPLRERLRWQLMIALYRDGRQADALDVFWTARRALMDELGIEPSPALQRAQQAILRQDPSLEPALATPDARVPRNEFPISLTQLLGRAEHVRAAAEQLRAADRRTLTITGPGGIGKTRLAVEVARKLAGDFERGAVFVGLEHARDPAAVEAEVAAALGLGGLPPGSLWDYVRDREILLVLDNCEQLLEGASIVTALLAASPRSKILLTSRTPLQHAGEHVLVLPPLALPGDSGPRTPDTLIRVPSVALFVQRCQSARHDFSLTSENAEAVAAICARLEGIPLSLELAAARITLLSPQAMLERLESRLTLLTGASRASPSRHDSIRATIDWSYDLLPPEEQRFYAWLGAFRGGFTLHAVEALWDRQPPALDGLAALVGGSLVEQAHGPSSRFGMLETLCEHAREKLAASGEEAAVRAAHLRVFLELAEQARPELDGPHQAEWLRRLAADDENLRAAQEFAFQSRDSLSALRLAAALGRFWRAHGHLDQARAALKRALDQVEGAPVELHVTALNALGAVAGEQGDVAAAHEAFDRAVAIARENDLPALERPALANLGVLAFFAGDYAGARAQYEELLTLYRNDGNVQRLAIILENLGFVALAQSRTGEAVELFEESYAIAVELENEERMAAAGQGLAEALLARGDKARAGELLAECLRISFRLGEPGLVAEVLDVFASLTADDPAAVMLLAAAEEIRGSIRARVQPDRRERRDERLARAHAALTAEQARDASDEGRRLTVEQAVDRALALVGQTSVGTGS